MNSQTDSHSQLPIVSILVATRDRHQFVPQLLRCIKNQTYPLNRIELVVGDDGKLSSQHLFPKNTKYIRYRNSVSIGKKRNDLKRVARGDILATMDDDDYYFPEYISHAVKSLRDNPEKGLAVQKQAYILYPIRWTLETSGPWESRWPGASFVYTSSYAKTHNYDDRPISGEEWSFTDNFKVEPVILDPNKTMIVVSHRTNTSNKNNLVKRSPANKFLQDLIPKGECLLFYQKLHLELKKHEPAVAFVGGRINRNLHHK